METKKHNFGILSTAGIAAKWYPAFEDSPLTQLVAIASRTIEKAQKYIDDKQLQNVKAYGTYDELIADPTIDSVYIPLPTGLKYEWTKKVLESGKNALVEKPLCGSVDTKQLQELLEIAKKNNKQIMDCTMWVHSSRTHLLKEKLNSGELGTISKVISGLSFKSDEEFMKNNIRGDANLEPLGALGDVTWYSTMAALWAFNFEEPIKIQAITWKKVNDVYTSFSGIIYFKNDRVAFVDGSFIEAHRQNFEIVGDKGTYRIDDFVGGNNQQGNDSAFWTRFVGSGNYKYTDQSGKAEIREIEKCDHVVNLVNEFVQRAQKQDDTQYWGKRSLLCQQVITQLNLSAIQNGAILNFDNTL